MIEQYDFIQFNSNRLCANTGCIAYKKEEVEMITPWGHKVKTSFKKKKNKREKPRPIISAVYTNTFFFFVIFYIINLSKNNINILLFLVIFLI